MDSRFQEKQNLIICDCRACATTFLLSIQGAKTQTTCGNTDTEMSKTLRGGGNSWYSTSERCTIQAFKRTSILKRIDLTIGWKPSNRRVFERNTSFERFKFTMECEYLARRGIERRSAIKPRSIKAFEPSMEWIYLKRHSENDFRPFTDKISKSSHSTFRTEKRERRWRELA